MTIITFPDTRDTINAIRGAIGREVLFNTTVSVSGCSNCSLDPVNNLSTNYNCPVCSGLYWISTFSGVSISGHVRWGPADDPDPRPGGVVFTGDCVVTIEHTPANMAVVQAANYVTVDGRKMNIKRHTWRGHKDINRIRIELKEK